MITINTVSKKYGKAEVLNLESLRFQQVKALGWLEIMVLGKQHCLIFY